MTTSLFEQELDAALSNVRDIHNSRKQRQTAMYRLGLCLIHMREQMDTLDWQYILQSRNINDRLRDDCMWSVWKEMLAHVERNAA
jgi:hypothetical protein